MNRLIALTLAISIALGCNPQNIITPVKRSQPERYIELVCVAAGMSTGSKNPIPSPFEPTPTPPDNPPTPTPNVKRPAQCSACNQRGYNPTGDGILNLDCPECDYDGDGDVNDPDEVLPVAEPPKQTEPVEPKPKPAPKAKPDKEPVVIAELKLPSLPIYWESNLQKALRLAKEQDKKILVLLDDSDIDEIWFADGVTEFVIKNFIPFHADTSDSKVANDWGAIGAGLDIITKTGDSYVFKGPVWTILNTEGQFTISYQSETENLIQLLLNET